MTRRLSQLVRGVAALAVARRAARRRPAAACGPPAASPAARSSTPSPTSSPPTTREPNNSSPAPSPSSPGSAGHSSPSQSPPKPSPPSSGDAARRAPILPGIQALASRLVTSVTLIVTSLAPAARAVAAPLSAPPADPVIEVVAIAEPAPYSLNSTTITRRVERTATTWARTRSAHARPCGASPNAPSATGCAGRDIRDANVGRTMPDGTTITAEHRNHPTRLDSRPSLRCSSALQRREPPRRTSHHRRRHARRSRRRRPLLGPRRTRPGRQLGTRPDRHRTRPVLGRRRRTQPDRLLPPDDPDLIYPGQRPRAATRAHRPNRPTSADRPGLRPRPRCRRAVRRCTDRSRGHDDSNPDYDDDASARSSRRPPSPTPAPAEQQAPAATVTTRASIVAGLGAGCTRHRRWRRRRDPAPATAPPSPPNAEPGTTTDPPPVETVDYKRQIRRIADTEAVALDRSRQQAAHPPPRTRPRPPAPRRRRHARRPARRRTPPRRPVPAAARVPRHQRRRDRLATRPRPRTRRHRSRHRRRPALQPRPPTRRHEPPAATSSSTSNRLGAHRLDGDPDAITRLDAHHRHRHRRHPVGQLLHQSSPSACPTTPRVLDRRRPARRPRCVGRAVLPRDAPTQRTRSTATPYQQRVQPGEIFHPTIVLVGPGHTDLATQLADVAALDQHATRRHRRRRHSATPTASTSPAGGATLEPSGIDFTPAQGNPTEVASVAAPPRPRRPTRQPRHPRTTRRSASDDAERRGHERHRRPDRRDPRTRPVEVQILTPRPRIHGLGKEPQAKQLAVICYLAYHRRHLLATAPRRLLARRHQPQHRRQRPQPDPQSCSAPTTPANHRLSIAINNGAHQLSDDVGCDWTRFERLRRLAKHRPSRCSRAADGSASGSSKDGRARTPPPPLRLAHRRHRALRPARSHDRRRRPPPRRTRARRGRAGAC